MTFGNFKVEIRRGPAPDTSKGIFGMGSAIAAARKLAHEKEEERLRSQMKQRKMRLHVPEKTRLRTNRP
jgi:ATP-dependent RNA helicase DDX46/PRP5